MKVRQLIGRNAGQIIEMPYHVAQACLIAGTAALPNDPVRVRGLDSQGFPLKPVKTVEQVPPPDRMIREYVRKDGGRQFHPLDHDKDGAPGGALPADQRTVDDALRAEYERKAGKPADRRWGEKRLREEIAKL